MYSRGLWSRVLVASSFTLRPAENEKAGQVVWMLSHVIFVWWWATRGRGFLLNDVRFACTLVYQRDDHCTVVSVYSLALSPSHFCCLSSALVLPPSIVTWLFLPRKPRLRMVQLPTHTTHVLYSWCPGVRFITIGHLVFGRAESSDTPLYLTQNLSYLAENMN